MKSFLHFIIVLVATVNLICAEPISDEDIVSPKKRFKIMQTREEEGVTAKLIFEKPQKSIVLEPSPISWRGFFTVSPDEKWILRIQKTGSGDNTAILYEVKDDSVSEVRPDLGRAAWDFFDGIFPTRESGLYHTGFDFVEWDSKGNLVLTMDGTSNDSTKSPHVHGFMILYHLSTKQFTKGQSGAAPNHAPATHDR